jgi:hypothetical protein
MLGLQNEREWQVFCAQVLERPELASDPRFSSNSRRTAGARRAARADRRGLRAAQLRAADRQARRRADCQRAHERHARRLGAPAAQGARPLDRGRYARAARSRPCCHPVRSIPSRRAWMPCRRSGSTATRFCWNSAGIRPRSSGCGRWGRSERCERRGAAARQTHGVPSVKACSRGIRATIGMVLGCGLARQEERPTGAVADVIAEERFRC